MDWVVRTFSSSIGKKQFMAVTGLFFCCFLTVHLIGNLFLYAGMDAFNSYVEHLHQLEPVIIVTEIGLAFFALIHISMAFILYFQNLAARPASYLVKKSSGGSTPASSSMPYTGLLIFIFIIIHLINIKFADHTNVTEYEIVMKTLSSPALVGYYIFSTLVVAFHVNHGLWSAFQTFGLSHVKYTPLIEGISRIFSVIVGLGFGLIPIYIAIS